MKLDQLYIKYNIPPNLQRHHLRVAAVAQIITENWKGPEINNNAIIWCCFFHDASKLINFNLSEPEMFEEEAGNIEYWRHVQADFIQKYGYYEHTATLKMCIEIGLSRETVELVDNLEWSYIPIIIETKNYASAITVYADMRIGPFGVLFLDERINNLNSRVKVDDYDNVVEHGHNLESMLQQYVNINLNKITDKQVNNRFPNLLNMEL